MIIRSTNLDFTINASFVYNDPSPEKEAEYDKLNEFCGKHVDIAKTINLTLKNIRIIHASSGK